MDYRDREGNIVKGNDSQDRLLKALYSVLVGRAALKLLSAPAVSKLAAAYMNSCLSTMSIDSSIRKNNISINDYVPHRYKSYNDFFTRKIRMSKRPICKEEGSLISPADGKVSFYQIKDDSRFMIKSSYYSVESLLRDAELAKKYEGGTCIIIRLTVDNYHRYSYAVSGEKGESRFIPGQLYTVNPAALEHVRVYQENSREYTVLHTEEFDDVVQMEVGALMVGRIHNHLCSGHVERGTEKGYFEFGGSSIVLLLKKDVVQMDMDILRNLKDGYETVVKLGERIGKSRINI